MFYFTREQEAKAVDLILKECNFCHRSVQNDSTSMSYVERDKNGYVVALVDLGLHKASASGGNNAKNGIEGPSQGDQATMATHHWKMPSVIGYLTHLKKLTVYNCKSLPREIVHLANSLQEIAFHFCDELDFEKDFPRAEFQSLHQLTDFRIHGRTACSSREAKRILPIPSLRYLPNLRYLYYRGPNYNCRRNEGIHSSSDSSDQYESGVSNFHLIQDLLHTDVRFRNSLEILEIERGNLTEDTVADLVSEVLPHYPKLKRLIFPNNRIASLGLVLAQQPVAIPPSVRLKCLNLLGNPVLDPSNWRDPRSRSTENRYHGIGNGNGNSNGNYSETQMRTKQKLLFEQTNLLRFLSVNEEITSLGHGITESAICTTEVLLVLDRNDGGAVLLSDRFRPLPLSVWPIVLERANQRKGYYDNSNVLYHLLRRGPVLGIEKPRRVYHTIHDNVHKSVENADPLASTSLTLVPPEWTATGGRSMDSIVRVSLYPVEHSIATPIETRTRKRKVSVP